MAEAFRHKILQRMKEEADKELFHYNEQVFQNSDFDEESQIILYRLYWEDGQKKIDENIHVLKHNFEYRGSYDTILDKVKQYTAYKESLNEIEVDKIKKVMRQLLEMGYSDFQLNLRTIQQIQQESEAEWNEFQLMNEAAIRIACPPEQ